MDKLVDSDLMLINRANKTHTITIDEVIDSLNPETVIQPSITSPSDGAGITISAESDEISGVVDGSNSGKIPPSTYEIKANDADTTYSGAGAVNFVGTFGEQPTGATSSAKYLYYNVFEPLVNVIFVRYAGEIAGYTMSLAGSLDGVTWTKIMDFSDLNGEGGSTHDDVTNGSVPYQYFQFYKSNGAAAANYGISASYTPELPSEVTFVSAKALSGDPSFKPGDKVRQDSGHLLTTGPISAIDDVIYEFEVHDSGGYIAEFETHKGESIGYTFSKDYTGLSYTLSSGPIMGASTLIWRTANGGQINDMVYDLTKAGSMSQTPGRDVWASQDGVTWVFIDKNRGGEGQYTIAGDYKYVCFHGGPANQNTEVKTQKRIGLSFTVSDDIENFRVGDQLGELVKSSWTIPPAVSNSYEITPDGDLLSIPAYGNYGFVPAESNIVTPGEIRKFEVKLSPDPDNGIMQYGWMCNFSRNDAPANGTDIPGFKPTDTPGICVRVSASFWDITINGGAVTTSANKYFGFTAKATDTVDVTITLDTDNKKIIAELKIQGTDTSFSYTYDVPGMQNYNYYFGVCGNNYRCVFSGYSTKDIVTVVGVDTSKNKLTVDKNLYTVGEVVIGPDTTPGTGEVVSIDPATKLMVISDNEMKYPQRWIANQGKYIIGEPYLSGDAPVSADPATIQSSPFESDPPGSLTHGKSEWWITDKSDLNYTGPNVIKHESPTDLTEYKVTLEDDTEYRVKVKHKSDNGIDSLWSEDVLFKTEDKYTAIFTAKPSMWKMRIADINGPVKPIKDCPFMGDKLLTNVVVSGASNHAACRAIDGTSSYITNFSGTANSGGTLTYDVDDYEVFSAGYKMPFGAVDTNRVFYYSKDNVGSALTPTSLTNSTLCASMGAVNRVACIINDNKLYVMSDRDHPDWKYDFGTGSDFKNDGVTLNLLDVQFSDPDEFVYRATTCAGGFYTARGFILLTNKNRIYRIGIKHNGSTDKVPVSSPEDLTPPGVEFSSIGTAIGSYSGSSNSTSTGGPYGFYAVSTTNELYGVLSNQVAGFPAQPHTVPVSKLGNASRWDGVISICGGYTWGGSGTVVKNGHQTVMCKIDGIWVATGTNDNWEKVSNDSFYEPGDYLGVFTVNSGSYGYFCFPVGPQT